MIFIWFVFSALIGFLGINKKTGFVGSMILSLLLSPVIGLIITLFSEPKDWSKMKGK